MKLTYFFKPPCPKCPYILGRAHSLVNPCPQCKENGYQLYKRFLSEDIKVQELEYIFQSLIRRKAGEVYLE